MEDATEHEPRLVTWVRANPNLATAAIITVFVIAAGIILPWPWLLGFTGFMITGATLILAGYWYEQAIRSEAEAFAIAIDNTGLAEQNAALVGRLAEALDELTLLRDDNTMMLDELEKTPIPFEIVGDQVAPVIPLPRSAGNQS